MVPHSKCKINETGPIPETGKRNELKVLHLLFKATNNLLGFYARISTKTETICGFLTKYI